MDRAQPPAYRIVTERLVIRCYDPADAPVVKATIDGSLETLKPWMPWVKDEPLPLQHKIDLLRKFRSQFDLSQDFTYGVFKKDEDTYIGGCGLHTRAGYGAREIGYWVAQSHEKQGYATEMTAALARVAFEVDEIVRLEIRVDPENAASQRVPEKLGIPLEHTARRRIDASDGTFHDAMVFVLVKDDYAASPCAQARIEVFDAAGRPLL